ncbi:hypothetical protein TNCV_5027841 [Trichonephila clavipes]|nr:hypothetical protein TNCV_5027841 [Trichonephila clavipes]
MIFYVVDVSAVWKVGVPEEHGIAQSSPGFGKDFKMMAIAAEDNHDLSTFESCQRLPGRLDPRILEVGILQVDCVVIWLEERRDCAESYSKCPLTSERGKVRRQTFEMQFHGKIVEVEIGGFAIYRLFGEFRRVTSYCHLYGAQGLGQRQAYF